MCLRWKDVCFYIHQSEDETEPTFNIAANVTIKWSKGQGLKESEWTTIALPKDGTRGYTPSGPNDSNTR